MTGTVANLASQGKLLVGKRITRPNDYFAQEWTVTKMGTTLTIQMTVLGRTITEFVACWSIVTVVN